MSKVADDMVSKMLFLIMPINYCLQMYSINLVDPTRKIEGVVKKLRDLADFVTLEQLTQQVELILKSPNGEPIQLGYYEPGHGTKGKKRFPFNDEDVLEMKEVYEMKKDILLWCYDPSIPCLKPAKKPRDGESAAEPNAKVGKSRYENALQKRTGKVKEILESLKKKHSGTYKLEQLRAWANMVQKEKHKSLDEPPVSQFFDTKATDKENRSASDAQSIKRVSDRETLSPAKRVSLRSQCIEQLEKWYRLMESGAISRSSTTNYKASYLMISKSIDSWSFGY